MSRRKPALDGCEFCLGAKGGTPGNENRFAGHLACDFCTVLIIDVRREVAAQIAAARPQRVRAATPSKKAAE